MVGIGICRCQYVGCIFEENVTNGAKHWLNLYVTNHICSHRFYTLICVYNPKTENHNFHLHT